MPDYGDEVSKEMFDLMKNLENRLTNFAVNEIRSKSHEKKQKSAFETSAANEVAEKLQRFRPDEVGMGGLDLGDGAMVTREGDKMTLTCDFSDNIDAIPEEQKEKIIEAKQKAGLPAVLTNDDLKPEDFKTLQERFRKEFDAAGFDSKRVAVSIDDEGIGTFVYQAQDHTAFANLLNDTKMKWESVNEKVMDNEIIEFDEEFLNAVLCEGRQIRTVDAASMGAPGASVSYAAQQDYRQTMGAESFGAFCNSELPDGFRYPSTGSLSAQGERMLASQADAFKEKLQELCRRAQVPDIEIIENTEDRGFKLAFRPEDGRKLADTIGRALQNSSAVGWARAMGQGAEELTPLLRNGESLAGLLERLNSVRDVPGGVWPPGKEQDIDLGDIGRIIGKGSK